MAQNISLMGATFLDVPSVLLPIQGGGTAQFDDTSDANATASDILSGKTAYVNGAKITGTGSGGDSAWKKIASEEFAVSNSTSSIVSVGNITLPLSEYTNKNTVLWVHVRDKAGKREGYHYGGDYIFFHYLLANGDTARISTKPSIYFQVKSGGDYGAAVAAGYGVYANRLYYTSQDHYVEMSSRYTSSAGTINGTYICDVYVLTPPSGMTLFA